MFFLGNGIASAELARVILEVKIPSLGDIEQVEILTQEPGVRIISKQGPLKNYADRDHCIEYIVAWCLINGSLNADSYSDTSSKDPQIEYIRNCTVTKEDKNYTKSYYDLNDNETPSGSIVCVIGKVSGRDSMIIANDATVKGGTYFPITLKKHLRSLEIAKENNLACINLVDSGGANLREQTGIFADKEGFGRIFFEMANMSSVGIPQISAVLGS